MNITDIKNLDTELLTSEQIAGVLGCQAHSIRCQAHADPRSLGFPVIVIGRRVKIPRKPFIEFIEKGV